MSMLSEVGDPPISCADFTFPLLPHDSVLDLVGALEIRAVDVGLFEGRSHLWPSKQLAHPSVSGAALKKRLADRGLGCADVFLQVDEDFAEQAANHPQPEYRRRARDTFERVLEYAGAVEAHHLTILPGIVFPGESRGDSLARAAEELSWRVERCADARISFGVEAHLGSIGETPEQALELIERVEGLELTLDFTHFERSGIPSERVLPLVEHASHFHVRGARPGSLQSSFRDNEVPYGRVLRQLEARGYRGFVCLEYVWTEWEHCNRTDNLSETILWRDYVRSRRWRDEA